MNKNLNDISSYIQILQDCEYSPDTIANNIMCLKICELIETSLTQLKQDYIEKLPTVDIKC